jgi:AAA domain
VVTTVSATPTIGVLDFAKRLGSLGVPIFVAEPGVGSEFRRPSGWQALTVDGNAERLARFRAGDAVCAVTGDVLAVVDVDPRNGGDVGKVARVLRELNVRVFGVVATPGSGTHFYVAGHAELMTAHGLADWPGVDIQSHGANVFLPGTMRPRYGGAGYVVGDDADLDALAEGDADGSEALVGWVAEHRGSDDASFDASPPWDGTPPDKRQLAYMTTALRDQAAIVSATTTSRNNALFLAALKLGSYVKGAGLPDRQVAEALTEAATTNGLVADDGLGQTRATIRSGIRASKPRAVPSATDVADVFGATSVEVVTDAMAFQVTEVDGDSIATDETGDAKSANARKLVLTAASTIKPRRVRWLWASRLALGSLALLAGMEGLGKSTLAYWLVARITRGELPGEYEGTPRGVLICASEDSWEHTIVPRLIAAGADLTRVFRVEVVTADDVHLGLSLPRDLRAVERAAREADAALLLLDPLMSRLADDLDTHRDGDVRRALEPLVALADRAGMAVLGLIHHNKSGSTDPLQLVMGSKAFTAVARSVHTVIADPDDETVARRLFGTPKNNLGRSDLPVLAFTIESHAVPTDDGDAWTGRLAWADAEVGGTIADAMRRAADTGEDRTATSEAVEWLRQYMVMQGTRVPSADVKLAARKEGHSDSALHRARKHLRLTVEQENFPRRTFWAASAEQLQSWSQSFAPARGEITTETTDTTGQSRLAVDPVVSVVSAVGNRHSANTTALPGETQ